LGSGGFGWRLVSRSRTVVVLGVIAAVIVILFTAITVLATFATASFIVINSKEVGPIVLGATMILVLLFMPSAINPTQLDLYDATIVSLALDALTFLLFNNAHTTIIPLFRPLDILTPCITTIFPALFAPSDYLISTFKLRAFTLL